MAIDKKAQINFSLDKAQKAIDSIAQLGFHMERSVPIVQQVLAERYAAGLSVIDTALKGDIPLEAKIMATCAHLQRMIGTWQRELEGQFNKETMEGR